ncbi:hypothetical protein ACFL4W_04010 [Planctomycetota bacterium]
MGIRVITVIAVCLIAAAPLCADRRVQPGNRFSITHEGMGKPRGKSVSKMQTDICIPVNYTTDRPFPVLVWIDEIEILQQGDHRRGEHVGGIRNLRFISKDKDYILVAIPLPADTAAQCTWEALAKMLEPVDELIPNIMTGKRVAFGFRHGGDAILHQLAASGGKFQEYFQGFIVGGPCSPKIGDLRSVRGRPLLIYYGDHDSDQTTPRALDLAVKKQDIGHELMILNRCNSENPNEPDFPRFRAWLNDKVLFRGVKQALTDMQAAQTIKNWPEAVKNADHILKNTFPHMTEYSQAKKIFDQASQHAAEEADKLLAASPTKGQLRNFLARFGVCPCAEKVKAALNALGITAFEKLLNSRPTALKVKKFMTEWQGLPVFEKALTKYDTYAQKDLDSILAKDKDVALAKKLIIFIKKWTAAPAAAKARAALEAEAAKALTAAEAIDSRTKRKHKLKSIIKYFAGTAAAGKAAQLLK